MQTGCLTQIRSAGRPKDSPGVAGTSAVAVAVVVAAVAVEGTTVAAAVGVTILLAVGRVGAEPVVVPVTLAADATTQPVVEPIVPAWPLAGLAVARD